MMVSLKLVYLAANDGVIKVGVSSSYNDGLINVGVSSS